jgi:hypothetical protein
LGFAAAFLRAAVVLDSAFSGFAFFSVAVTWRLLWSLSDWLGWGQRLHNTPTSDHVAPHLAQVSLLSRGPGPPSFRVRRVVRGDCLTTLSRRRLCKGCTRLLPFHTGPIVRFMVAPTNAAEAALGSHQKCDSPRTRRTEGRVRSFAAYGRSAGSVCIRMGPLLPRMSPPTL